MAVDISVVIVARNELPEMLEATVRGALETSGGRKIEIVVVDDGSATPVDLNYSEARVLRNEKPIGTSRSRRKGAAASTGGVLISTDAHMRFATDWLENMLAHLDSNSLLCAAWWDYELTRPVCWGADFVWRGERDHAAGRRPGFAFNHRTAFPGDGAVEVPMAIGACYMMLRTSYERCGGFSPFFRTWGKLEQDLCARAWIAGLKVKCVTGARVGHFSRPKFPYPVRWEDIEFNQAASVRTVFEAPVARALEESLQPLPADVQTWLDRTDFRAWRESIQGQRKMSDAEFFRRFVPGMPESVVRSAGSVATTVS